MGLMLRSHWLGLVMGVDNFLDNTNSGFELKPTDGRGGILWQDNYDGGKHEEFLTIIHVYTYASERHRHIGLHGSTPAPRLGTSQDIAVTSAIEWESRQKYNYAQKQWK